MRMFQQFSVNLLNMQRGRFKAIDYVMIKVPTSFAPIPGKRNFVQQQILGPAPMSLLEFVAALERIGDDPRPLGAILYFRGLSASTADLQTMRGAILRLREKGKRVLSFAPGYRTLEYYVASACDEILLPPGSQLETSGLFSQQVYLKEGLAAAGLQFDAIAISPYKGAADRFTRSEPSPEGREQTNWLLDSVYEMIVDGIAATRKMKPAEVKQMIDGALHVMRRCPGQGICRRCHERRGAGRISGHHDDHHVGRGRRSAFPAGSRFRREICGGRVCRWADCQRGKRHATERYAHSRCPSLAASALAISHSISKCAI